MKRAFVGILVSALLAGSVARAADAVTLAAQQEMLDNYKRLTATIEEFQTTQAAQQKQISALSSELSKVRDELARNTGEAANKESIRQLGEQIRRVDEARIADNKRIQDALERLGETIRKMPVGAPRRTTATELGNPQPVGVGKMASPRSNTNASGGAEEGLGFEYTVQTGDHHLGIIVKRYNDEKIPVTKSAIMAANPNVDWTRLKIGQKIFIPKPK